MNVEGGLLNALFGGGGGAIEILQAEFNLDSYDVYVGISNDDADFILG